MPKYYEYKIYGYYLYYTSHCVEAGGVQNAIRE